MFKRVSGASEKIIAALLAAGLLFSVLLAAVHHHDHHDQGTDHACSLCHAILNLASADQPDQPADDRQPEPAAFPSRCPAKTFKLSKAVFLQLPAAHGPPAA